MPSDKENIQNIRWAILEMIHRAGEGHIPSAFSVVEILYALYSHIKEEDSFFLSKGHASAALYAVLAHFGKISKDELDGFCKYDSRLGGHHHRRPPAVMNSSGSLGHGFPIAAGYAMSKKIKNESGRVFCLIGDGESNEGSVWETAMYAEQLHLDNLVCIVDKNNSQTRAITSSNLPGKFTAFGWVVEEADGHNLGDIKKKLFEIGEKDAPRCIIANTLKGKGISVMERDFWSWHHRAPTPEEMVDFKKEIFQ